ncbi:MAG: E3 binding domain-containing protein, partial [Gemmatimonadetes bacterium]|nr:E3 binding domain-containing protein [Gemmatimonadota bacterium]
MLGGPFPGTATEENSGRSSMARVEVIMPQMGESIVEGTVSKWLKKVGDEIKRDEPILEISTDKVDAEIPSPADGILAEIKVAEGETVEVQTVIAVLETDKDAAVSPAAALAPAPTQPAAETSASPPSAPIPTPTPTPAPAAVSEPVAVPAGDGTAQTAEERLRHRSTPLVRKIAEEHQLDISQIPGTGHAGRVTKKDILEFIESGVAAAP